MYFSFMDKMKGNKKPEDSIQYQPCEEESTPETWAEKPSGGIIKAWKVVSAEQFYSKLNSIVEFDEEAYWLRYDKVHETVAEMNEENNAFRINMKEGISTFEDGLYLVYNRGRVQMENKSWLEDKGLAIESTKMLD